MGIRLTNSYDMPSATYALDKNRAGRNATKLMKMNYEILIIQLTSFGLFVVIAAFAFQELHPVSASFHQGLLDAL